MRVLWIDDEPQVVMSSRRSLSARGFQVEHAPDGYTALASVARTQFDVIVLDMRLPGLSGLGVLQALRAEGIGTPVMVLTSFSEQFAFKAGQLGAVLLKDKPLVGDRLVAAINEAAACRHLGTTISLFRAPDGRPTGSIARLLEYVEQLTSVDCFAPGTSIDVARRLVHALGDPDITFPEFSAGVQALRLIIRAGASGEPWPLVQVGELLGRYRDPEALSMDPRALEVLGRLESSGSHCLALTDRLIAMELGLHPTSLRRLLGRSVGLNFVQCRRTVVVRRGIHELVNSDEQVAQIAWHLGYKHCSQFDRDCVRVLGIAPRGFRALSRAEGAQRGRAKQSRKL